jgi:hypothetical protein
MRVFAKENGQERGLRQESFWRGDKSDRRSHKSERRITGLAGARRGDR